MRDIKFLGLPELARALDAGEFSPVELLQAYLDRIAAVNPALNALVTLDEAGSMAAARQSEARQRSGKRLGPLDGIPLSIKDNLFVRGMRATWGSRLYENFVPQHEDIFVERLRAAGAVIVAKSNTPEFALAIHTENPVFGRTRNPWASDLVPGGSSGGAAASVAAGMLPLAIGTDAGGSIRLPASFTGVVGLKPSMGRIPRLHGFPPIVTDFQVIGLMARSVSGVELGLSVLAGPDDRDRASLAFRSSDAALEGTARIGVIHEAGGEPVEPEVAQAFRQAALAAEQIGRVEEMQAPYDLDELKRFWSVLSPVGLGRVVRRFPDWEQLVTPAMAGLARQGLAVTAVDYADALDRVAAFRSSVASAFRHHDLLLTPTSPALPWTLGSPPPQEIAGRTASPRTPLAFNTFANATGYPAISLPWTRSRNGLPIGVQLVAKFGQEPLLLLVAKKLEQLSPWKDSIPPEPSS